jgi:hypothetical protein
MAWRAEHELAALFFFLPPIAGQNSDGISTPNAKVKIAKLSTSFTQTTPLTFAGSFARQSQKSPRNPQVRAPKSKRSLWLESALNQIIGSLA